MITQAFHASQDAAPVGHQNRLRLFWILFILLHAKQGEVSKSDPSEISFRWLWQAVHFSTKKPIINKPALNNLRILLATVFHFVHPVEKDS